MTQLSDIRNASDAEPPSSPERPFIELSVNMPERYGLTSIQKFHTGEWIVCVHIRLPGEMMGLHHALGQHRDVNEATKLAIAKCEAKAVAPPPVKYEPFDHGAGRKIPGLDLSTLKI